MIRSTHPLSKLDARRQALGMTIDQLSERSGVSRPTVQRILAGSEQASFVNVCAVASALGMELGIGEGLGSYDMREQQATVKARGILKHVQATAGLESQGIPEASQAAVLRELVCQLLAQSPRKLWSK